MSLVTCVDLLDTRTALLFLCVFILCFYFLTNQNPPNFPPGPWGLPSLGNSTFVFDHRAVEKVAAKYGKIFSLRVSNERIVLVSGYKLVKEVLVTQGHNFLDRQVSHLVNEVFQGNGLPFNPHLIINSAVANIIASLVFGKRFDYDATNFQNLLHLSAESSLLADSPLLQLYNTFPSVMKHFRGPHTTILANYVKLVSFLKKEIEKHKKDWDPFNHRDLTDVYIGEIDKRRKDTDAAFSVDNLAYCILDLFEAGTGPMTSTLCWGLLLMVKHPEVQKETQAEIDRVVGKFRQPCLVDRASMPYTLAVLHEIQRVGNVLPLGMPHKASRDTTLGNYFIPKGTVIVTSLSSLLSDKDEWERPQKFDPKHFLDEQGHFRKREAFLPFSAGKRMCVGENLACTELFFFFTCLLKRFNFSAPKCVQLPVEAQGASVLSPKPFNICVSLR